ncbi:winged helix-turn-helix domain-containing protein [Mangrovibrevibacter kandeliae]|uniref:winged helix-turn-helix domain-containing protein n=1 Tax=Mangrovibrevibacter kandeliae TaxID=2968473 RepID=UPI0021194E7B|nr:winged helix-turn-helix domain-containing protein [Aurantimonas sp. CSK15Z-1]MCQ8781319.1 winged helix-turn-helix domain-containing protein [Aurantimonas sp. CSK15Z-1]
MTETIPLATARRIALAAQGFVDPAPSGAVDRRHLQRVLGRIGLLQIDSVSVLARAHYLPLYSRLGAYPRRLLDQAAWGPRPRLFEYWAHEASLLPVETQPLLRWRMARAADGHGIYSGLARFGVERRDFVETVLRRVEADGPLAASDLEGDPGEGGWWGWSDAKRAVEWLFWAGRLTTATRRGSFERVYDLPERVLPEAVLAQPTPQPQDAHRELIRIAARAHGIATASDLRDYFRLAPDQVKPRLPELVESGDLLPVSVPGWSQPAFLYASARRPRRVHARALLAPFDPLIWERSRTERLFGFRYRLEIYTPADKRQHGYYVLPFLLNDRLVARVDLKTDRRSGRLLVLATGMEDGAPADTLEHLAVELRRMADWLGVAEVEAVGPMQPGLRAALAVSPPAEDGAARPYP